MSWDIELVHPKTKEVAILPSSHDDGGTIVLGGTNHATLNITYNYSSLFRSHLHPDGLQWIDGKTGSEAILLLSKAVNTLGVKQDLDYWKATQGNAGYALNILLRWARWFPDHTFCVG
jgi:hypothetical protein